MLCFIEHGISDALNSVFVSGCLLLVEIGLEPPHYAKKFFIGKNAE